MRDTSSNEPQSLPPPPGIIGSLRTGFDVVAAHITAILMPVALDLLLWLGPHLRIDQLMSQTFKDMLAAWSELGITPEQIRQAQDSYTSQIVPKLPEINLFASLRTFPVGVASLLAASRPLTSPLGTPLAIQINSIFELMVCAGGLTLIGWFYGALYFRWIAALVTADAWVDGGRAISQTLLYSFIWSILFWILGTPLFLFVSLLYSLNPLIGEASLLILTFASMWLIVPVFFSPLGMFVRKQNAFASILGSLQMSRLTLPSSSLFVLTVLLIGFGLNYVWSFPASNSWLTLVAILGHAFIATALLASSFVYYNDTTLWIQTVRERLRAGAPTQQA